MKGYPERSPEAIARRKAQIVELSRLGHTVREICEQVGVGAWTVVATRREAGVGRGKVKPFTEDELETARQLLDDGASYSEVARTIGRDARVVARKFPGHGWSVEQRSEHVRVLKKAGMMRGFHAQGA